MPALVLDNGLAPAKPQAIIWNNADPGYRRIYAAIGGHELDDNWMGVERIRELNIWIDSGMQSNHKFLISRYYMGLTITTVKYR